MRDSAPALKGQMGDWNFYVTTMKLGKVAREMCPASDIHPNPVLSDLIRDEIGSRVQREMVPYLLGQPQRFFGALVVAVQGGAPMFTPLFVPDLDDVDRDDPARAAFGILHLDGSHLYFVLDGRHRLRSIQLALKKQPELAKEEVTVIIVWHENTPDGVARTRGLSASLNRRAEPARERLNIALDEDDAVAIVTRRLVQEHRYLAGLELVKSNKEGLSSRQLAPTKGDGPYFTTLLTLYEANEFLLKSFAGGMDVDWKFKQSRPSEEDLEKYYEYLALLWTEILEGSPELLPILEKRQKPGSLRIPVQKGGGGSAIARPIGQLVIAEVIGSALRQGADPHTFIRRLFTEVSFNLDHAPHGSGISGGDFS